MDEQYQRDCKELDSCCRRLRQGEPMRKRIRELMRSTTSYRDETLAEVQKLQNRVESQITILTTEIDKIENPLKRPLFLEVEETYEKRNDDFDIPIEANEPLYCYCNRVSFGKMVACENEDCQGGEWFHFECIGLKTAPKGSWYCGVCSR